MPLTIDIILDWIHEDGYTLLEADCIRPQGRQIFFEVTAENDGHRPIAETVI